MLPSKQEREEILDRLVSGEIGLLAANLECGVSEITFKRWCEARETGLFARLRKAETERKKAEKFGPAKEWLLTTEDKPTMSEAARLHMVGYQPLVAWVKEQPGLREKVQERLDAWNSRHLKNRAPLDVEPPKPMTAEEYDARMSRIETLGQDRKVAETKLDALLKGCRPA